MRSLSSMTAEVRSQTDEVRGFVDRLRMANRRMTGSTGEQPTQLTSIKGQMVDRAESPPLMDELNHALDHLNSATADLRSEVAYMEGWTETGAPMQEKAYVGSTRG